MSALAFWKAVVQDRSDFLERVIGMFEEERIRYCVIGGVGVNAYVEPVITQDLDVVVATDDLERARTLLEALFQVQAFEHSLNVRDPESRLQFQVHLDPEMADVLADAERRDVLGLELPVATPEALVRLKIRAAMDPARRRSKRGKDAMDIARLVGAQPALIQMAPEELRPLVNEFLDEEFEG